ncbi:MAG: cohesin domain-containing protein, partial [Gemmatimonadales bacterium]
ETNLLAGLIKRDQSKSKSGIPGLLDIPGVNRVFGNTNSTRTDTDIVLTLTPHIIRIPDITEEDLSTLWVGTEDNMQLRGPTRGLLGESPFATPEEPVAAGGPSAPPQESAPPAEAPVKGGSVTIVPPTPTQGAPPPEAEPSGEEEVEPEGEQPEETPEEQPPPATPEEPRPQDRTGQPQKPPNAPAVVRVVPSAPSYRVGDVITLEVRIDNATNVGSVPFHLKYNPQFVQFIPPGAEGSFMSGDGTGTIFLASDTPGAGEVVVGLSRMGGGAGVSGSGTLATFNFHASGGGRATFMFTGASVKDPQARNLPASFIAAAVGITQ